MKNILLSLIFVLLAGSLWSQQQRDVLQQMEHRMHNDPLIQKNANHDQNQMIDGEMDFLNLNMKSSEMLIRVDSILIVYEDYFYNYNFKDIY